MSPGRPVVRDTLPESSGPVFATRHTPPDLSGPHARPSTHGHAVLSLCTGGEARMEQSGEWRMREGDVLLVPAGAAHRVLERRELEHWSLGFHAPLLVADGDGASDATAALLDPLERVRDGGCAIASIPTERQPYLLGLFRELASTSREPADRRTLAAVQKSLLTLVLAEVARATSTHAAPRAGSVVADALRFIERSCRGPLTVREVAAAVGRTPTYVTTALTQATGRSAVQWIVSGRMAEARRLLLHSDEMVDVIAERVGYADATHFIRMFRREHGATPASWRAARVGEARSSVRMG